MTARQPTVAEFVQEATRSLTAAAAAADPLDALRHAVDAYPTYTVWALPDDR